MRIFVIGGTGFIGRRLVRRHVARGHTSTCLDANPNAHSFADLGPNVPALRGDVAQLEDVMCAMTQPNRNASSTLPTSLAVTLRTRRAYLGPHVAMRINILDTDNCFEAARSLGAGHTVYAGSYAPYGKQSNYGERAVTKADPTYGEYQHARHKIMNEWRALDYSEKFGMCITGIRVAYVTSPLP